MRAVALGDERARRRARRTTRSSKPIENVRTGSDDLLRGERGERGRVDAAREQHADRARRRAGARAPSRAAARGSSSTSSASSSSRSSSAGTGAGPRVALERERRRPPRRARGPAGSLRISRKIEQRRRDRVEGEERLERVEVDLAARQRAQLGRERELAAGVAVVERLDPVAVAREHEPPRASRPRARPRTSRAAARANAGPSLLVEVHEHLGVAVRAEAVAGALELARAARGSCRSRRSGRRRTVPSSFAIGWSPPSRSMIASRRAARPTGPSTMRPVAVGPAVEERRAHRARAGRGRRRRAPRRFRRSRTCAESSVGLAAPKRLAEHAEARWRRACAGRAAPSGRRSTRGRARASRPSTSRSRAAPARSRSGPGRTTSRCQYAGRSCASSREEARAGSGAGRRRSCRRAARSRAAGSRRAATPCSQRPIRVSSASRALDELLAEVRAEPLLGAAPQRAELEHLEEAAAAADALAAVEQRPAARRHERERDQRRSAARGRAGRSPANEDVERAQLEVDAPFRRPADERREPLDERVARPRLGSGHERRC